MGEPDDISTEPGSAEPQELGAAGPWHNVPKPSAEELTAPAVQIADPPRMPALVKFGGLVLVAVLLLLAGWLGLTMGSAGGNVPPAPTPSESTWALLPPMTLGNLVQGETTTTDATTPGDRDLVRADYSDGSAKVLLLLSRPEEDLQLYLDYLGVDNVQPTGDASCGISVDNGVPVCARVLDGTAIAVAGLTEQSFTALATLVDSFYSALR